MKVLQINCVYKTGSTGKIVYDLHKTYLNKNIKSYIVYGRGGLLKEKNIFKTSTELEAKLNNLISRINGRIYGGCYFSTKKIIKMIKKINPDIVHLHCLNGYFVNVYKLLNFLKCEKYKTIITLHAEFMYTGNCGHALECNQWIKGCKRCPDQRAAINSYIVDTTEKNWKKMNAAFSDFDNLTITSVSPWLANRAKQSNILKRYNNKVILNGIDTNNTFFPRNKNDLRKKYLLDEDDKIIIHVTSGFNNPIKGGKYIIQLAKDFQDTKIKILLVGRGIENITLPNNIINFGEITNQDTLAELYSLSDVTILTSKKETFSMIVAESLCCGTPVVGFKAGAPEMITIQEYSDFVEYADMDDLKKKIERYLNLSLCNESEIINVAKTKYSLETMVNNYLQLYQEKIKDEL